MHEGRTWLVAGRAALGKRLASRSPDSPPKIKPAWWPRLYHTVVMTLVAASEKPSNCAEARRTACQRHHRGRRRGSIDGSASVASPGGSLAAPAWMCYSQQPSRNPPHPITLAVVATLLQRVNSLGLLPVAWPGQQQTGGFLCIPSRQGRGQPSSPCSRTSSALRGSPPAVRVGPRRAPGSTAQQSQRFRRRGR